MIFSDKGNEVILKALDDIDSFINNKINTIPPIDGVCSGFNAKVKEKLEKISLSLKIKNDEELQVYGEVMLISEKLADGNINDKIHHVGGGLFHGSAECCQHVPGHILANALGCIFRNINFYILI